MKKLTLLCLMLSFNSLAQESSRMSLLEICKGKESSSKPSMKMVKVEESNLLVLDQGFCSEFLKQQTEIQTSSLINSLDQGLKPQLDPNCKDEEIKQQDKWKIRFYASHSFTTYFNTDVTFQSRRYNVTIKDYEWAERSSREYFLPETWKKEGNNPFQMIDEPSNTFTVSLEKDGHEFFLSAFHPKFLQAKDQVKHIKGTIDGTPVDGYAPVNKPFDGYDQVPGESELVRNENTHRQMTFEIGYGHRFKLLDSKFGSLTYVPSIGVGVMVGQNYSVMIAENEWWEFEDGADPLGVQGFGGSITNRLELNTKKERFGLFYENKLAYYKQNHGFMDGTQKYNLGFMGNSVGMKFMINNPNNKKKKIPTNLP